jgi:hypothetical protein
MSSSSSGSAFSTTVKPYFTDCYRDHMSFMFDLWNPKEVCDNYDVISAAVKDGRMPPPADQGCEGEWNPEQRKKFLADFEAWHKGGCNPA